MASQLGQLLGLIGRKPEEVLCILSQPAGTTGALHVNWSTVADADSRIETLEGNIWFGVQPLDRPSHGRGRATDVTGVVALYADLDYYREGKPGGIPREMTTTLIDALSEILGQEPVALVGSGNGCQPYWAVERLNVSMGRQALLWWRQQVVETAAEFGLQVDTQVFDLARILRVPGPPNLKDPDDPKVTGLVVRGGSPVTEDRLIELMAKMPLVNSNSLHIGPRGQDVDPSDVERLFTQSQAERYIEEHALSKVRSTPQGSGFNAALNAAAFTLYAFVPDFLTDDQAFGLLAEAISVQFPAGPDNDDLRTIESGFGANSWKALKANEATENNPFWEFADHDSLGRVSASPVHLVEERDGITFKFPASRDGRPPMDCYLNDEFWDSRPILQQIRWAAWQRMVCPEALLSATFATLVGHVMPNITVHGGIADPASINSMFLLIGDPGSGKSAILGAARTLYNFDGAVTPYAFVPSSGQGVVAAFGQWVKPRGAMIGTFQRTRFTATAVVDESDTIRQLRTLQGSTLSSTLRSAAMGGMVGSHNANIETRTQLEPNTYSLSTIICAQPLLMDWLLTREELEGGLPQRFLWTPTDLQYTAEGSIPTVDQIVIPLPFEATPGEPIGEAMGDGPIIQGPRPRHVMYAPARVMEAMKQAREDRMLYAVRDSRRNNAHIMLTTLKVSGYLALMDGRNGITDEDWDLASAVTNASTAMMEWVNSNLEAEAARSHRNKAIAAGRNAQVQDEARHAALVERTAGRIKGLLETGPKTKSQISQKLSAPQRELFDEALDTLLDKIAEDGDGKYSLL